MREHGKIFILVAVLVMGFAVQKLGLLDLSKSMEWVDPLENSWWVPMFLILLQIVMYMLAFPGSIIMWSLGAIYQPWTATFLVVAGGVTGGLAAYFFATFMSSSWTRRFSTSRVFKILQHNSGFFQLCALRCLPGFPHSVINYSSGILGISLPSFIFSTAMGFGVKGFIYCSAVHSALHLEDNQSIINISNLWPLIVLVIFALLGIAVQKRYFPT